jgi:hypothetical protein
VQKPRKEWEKMPRSVNYQYIERKKCYKCGKNGHFACEKCRNNCCAKHIDLYYWYELSTAEGLKKKHAWLCVDCIEDIKEKIRRQKEMEGDAPETTHSDAK